jgi:hypothetical protein
LREPGQRVTPLPLTFLTRLAAQIPPPRRHTITYHGVLAAAAAKRDQIVPESAEDRLQSPRRAPHSAGRSADARANRRRSRPERFTWAELIRRTLLLDILACPCGARRRVLALVCDPAQIHRYLSHLGLPTSPPPRAPPRLVAQALPFD